MTPGARRDWGATIAMILGLVLFFAVHERYTLGNTTVTNAIGYALGAVCAFAMLATAAGWGRRARLTLLAGGTIFAVAGAIALIRVTVMAIYEPANMDAVRLLKTAVFIWIANVLAFAVIYDLLGESDFLFTKPSGGDAPPLVFLDFLFLSFTTATAFSPTDTPPLTTRARMFMMGESAISLMTIAIAAARAVNML